MTQDKLARARQQLASANAAYERSKTFLDVARKSGDKGLVVKMETSVREDHQKYIDAQAAMQFEAVAYFVEGRIDHRLKDMRGQLDKAVKGQVHSVKEYVARRLDVAELGTEALMPRHEWRDTQIRFEVEPGIWGEWVDLEGPAGRNGLNGGGGGVPRNLVLDGGGAFDEHTTLNGGTASSVNQFALGGGGANTSYSVRTFNGGRAI